VESELYKEKALTYPKYFETSKKIRDIIELATSSTKAIKSVETKIVAKPFALPKKKTLTGAPSTFKQSEPTYAINKEKDINKINKSILRLLNEEDAQSLYRIIMLINLLITEVSS